jgi:hypothetical protein
MELYYKEIKSPLNVRINTRNECYNWGLDNSFPSLVESLVNNSATAKTCVNKSSRAIYGRQFNEAGQIKVNSTETLNNVLRQTSKELVKQGNAFLHIGYNQNYNISSIKLVPSTRMRVGKQDDKMYSGKFIAYDNWDKSKGYAIRKSEFITFYAYNSNEKVIQEQIEKDGGIDKYNGQIMHIKVDNNNIYSLPPIYPSMADALVESNSQEFRMRGSMNGFLNNLLLTVAPFASDDQRSIFLNNIEKLQGSKGSGNVLLLETSGMTDDVSSQMNIDQLGGGFDDTLFQYSDTQAEKNIAKSYDVPLILVSQTDNSVFGNSGELIRQAKIQLWENKEEERELVEDSFRELMKNFSTPLENLKIYDEFNNSTGTSSI